MTSPRLLLVDDDPDLGFVVRVLSRRCGHTLTHRLDAESAWESLDAERPDLILLDINLLGTSGLQFLRRLRASPAHACQPVAMFVQSVLSRAIADSWDAGADYHVCKDLVTCPDAWKQRLEEIVAHLHSRVSEPSISLKTVDIPLAFFEARHALLKLPPLCGMTEELLQAVSRRVAMAGSWTPEIVLAWMRGIDSPSTPEQAREFLVRLLDQVGCLFGQAACERMVTQLRTNR